MKQLYYNVTLLSLHRVHKFLAIARSEEQHPFFVALLREIWGNPIGYFLQLYVTLTILQRSYHPIESVD
jgi:hypothetical protein